jgi:hypothetical protein
VFTEAVSEGHEDRYNLSIAVAEKLFDDPHFGGLLYPTVPMWGNADNFALKPSYVDAFVVPTYAELLEITKIDGTKVTFDIVDEAHRFDADGTICWLGHRAQWAITEPFGSLTLEVVNGHWVARDAGGNIVDPI